MIGQHLDIIMKDFTFDRVDFSIFEYCVFDGRLPTYSVWFKLSQPICRHVETIEKVMIFCVSTFDSVTDHCLLL